MALHNVPIAQIERECLPCRRTIIRWALWLSDAFLVHSNYLRVRFPELGLGRFQFIETFWPACFELLSLAKAMRYVHQGGEVVP